MRNGKLGHIATPASGHRLQAGVDRLQAGVDWCADNGAYTGAYPGDTKYLAWLSVRARHAARCAFATAPDVVGDSTATLARSCRCCTESGPWITPPPWSPRTASSTSKSPGTTSTCCFWARRPGSSARPPPTSPPTPAGTTNGCTWVNSLQRLRHAAAIGSQSADGTYLTYGPDRNLPVLLRWLATVNDEPASPASA
jgi:hypothetical protein